MYEREIRHGRFSPQQYSVTCFVTCLLQYDTGEYVSDHGFRDLSDQFGPPVEVELVGTYTRHSERQYNIDDIVATLDGQPIKVDQDFAEEALLKEWDHD